MYIPLYLHELWKFRGKGWGGKKNGEKKKRKSADISNMPFAKIEWLGEGRGMVFRQAQ